MAAPKGHKRYGGRTKGLPNKLTAEMKATLVKAFDGIGGVKKLIEWGTNHPGEFYRLWIKLLPTEVTGADGEAIKLQVVEEIVADASAAEDRETPSHPGGVPA
jgi:hypothetical protein